MKRFSYTQDANFATYSLAPPYGYKNHHKIQQRGVMTSHEAERKRKMFINYVQVKFQQKNPSIEGYPGGKDYNREQVFWMFLFPFFVKIKWFLCLLLCCELIVKAEVIVLLFLALKFFVFEVAFLGSFFFVPK